MERPMFSDMLADRRRELGYSIRQASRILRLREDVLVAFEEGDFERMPKSGYAQGMLSSYARYLDLDAKTIVDAYNADLKAYKRGAIPNGRSRGNRRNGSDHNSTPQPYVATRGLLPTSGGLAGDMGSFATTRVHTRQSSNDEEYRGDTFDDFDSRYPQGRPYTRRVPANSTHAYRSGSSRNRRDIEMLEVEDYDDDLRLGGEASPYEAASTQSGRRSSRNISSSRRPRVERRTRQSSSGSRGRRGRTPDRGRRGSNQRNQPGLLSSNLGPIAVVAVAILLTVIIVFSIGSCIRQDTNDVHTVPVSEASGASSTSSSSASAKENSSQKSSSESDSGKGANSSSSSSAKESGTSTTNEETSVSVSVANDCVTWLEVECDGKSDVAETVNGPWQKTYTVEDSITIQASDTTAVSVVQDGRQVQFESMASGIGSIRIQGVKKTSPSSTNKDSSSKKSQEDESKQSNSSDSSESSTSSSSSHSSGNTDSAKMGNSSTGKKKDEESTSEQNDNAESLGYDEYGNSYAYGNEYGDDYNATYGY